MSISTELRSKQSRDNRELLDRAAEKIDELTALYENLLDDVKHHATRDICDICKYHDQNPDCCADCEECRCECVCRECRGFDKWTWRGAGSDERPSSCATL